MLLELDKTTIHNNKVNVFFQLSIRRKRYQLIRRTCINIDMIYTVEIHIIQMKLLKFHLLFQIFKIIVIKLQYLFFDNYSILYNNFNSSMRILNMKVVALQ